MLEEEEPLVEFVSLIALDEDGAGAAEVVGFELEDGFLEATEETDVAGAGNDLGIISEGSVAKEKVLFGLRFRAGESLVSGLAAACLV